MCLPADGPKQSPVGDLEREVGRMFQEGPEAGQAEFSWVDSANPTLMHAGLFLSCRAVGESSCFIIL
jgi:hypothetical protein